MPKSQGNVGSRAVAALVKNCQELGIQLLCKTAAKKILTDKEGKMNGVLASSEDKELKITAKSVVITTGGFGGNKEMMNRYFSIPGDTFSYSPALPYLTGDGMVMAAEVGAVTDQIILSIIGPHHLPWALSLYILMQRPNVMLVNKNGERYFDESIYPPDTAANMVRRQPGHIVFALLDEKIKQAVIQKRERFDMGNGDAWIDRLDKDFQKESAEGKKAKIANSWEEIAEFIGAKPEVLKATVERYNSFCDKGYDEDFLKDKKYLMPLRTPPYYAILGRLGFDTTFGGIKINERMEVVDKQDIPITGLYAGGDNAGGWVSTHYAAYGGTSLCWAFCSGFIAGENAAKYVSQKG
jgi:fumarate reductase flavoprotein subunit